MIPTIEEIVQELLDGNLHKAQAIKWLRCHAGVAQPKSVNRHGCSCELPHDFHRPSNLACPLNAARAAAAKATGSAA